MRYIGKHRHHAQAVDAPRDRSEHPEDWVALTEPGLVVTIDEVKLGRRGTGRHLRDADGPMYYDEGEPILDETEDGYSAYHVEACGRRHGRLIRAGAGGSAAEWEVVK